MPDTAQLTAEVHDLNDRLDAATKAYDEAKKTYEADQRFRKGTVRSLIVLGVILTALTTLSLWTALEVRSDQQQETVDACIRSSALRADIHKGMDAVLDEINGALNDPQTDAIVEKSKEAIRREIPYLVCGAAE